VQQAVEDASGRRPRLHAPPAEGNPTAAYAVSSARLAALGLRADLPLRTAVDETVRFCRDHEAELVAAGEP
ncbi:MAG: hypothetical protein ACRDY4_08230, partial [Acidimicrobiia bacterium]